MSHVDIAENEQADFKAKAATQKIRKYEIALAKLKLGHARLTHKYLTEKGRPPYCGYCLVPLTVKHVLVHHIMNIIHI